METSLLVLIVAVLALANAENFKEEFNRLQNECLQSNAVKPERLCLNVKLGVQKENGDIDRDGLRSRIEVLPILGKDVVDTIVANCGERRGATAAEAATALDHCMQAQFSQHVLKIIDP